MPRYRVPLYAELYRSVVVEADSELEAVALAKVSESPTIILPEGVTEFGSWLLDDQPEELD